MNLDEQDTAGRVDALAVVGVVATCGLGALPPQDAVQRAIDSGQGVVAWASVCAAIPFAPLGSRLAESARRPSEFFTEDSLNLFLSLSCGSPENFYIFFASGERDEALFAWAAWRIVFDLAHSAFRSRARHLLAGGDVEPILPRSEIVDALAALIPIPWRPATAFYHAACDFAFSIPPRPAACQWQGSGGGDVGAAQWHVSTVSRSRDR